MHRGRKMIDTAGESCKIDCFFRFYEQQLPRFHAVTDSIYHLILIKLLPLRSHKLISS